MIVGEKSPKTSRNGKKKSQAYKQPTRQVERKERRRRKEREGQKVRDDGFLEAQREPRVSCVAGCGTKVAENDQTNKPS